MVRVNQFMAYEVVNYVNGKAVTPPKASWGPVFNPARGVRQGKVCMSGAGEVAKAVAAARKAAAAWGATPVPRRAAVLFRYRRLVAEHAGELAKIVSREHGKTVPDAAGEVARGLEVIDYCTGLPELLKGEYSRAAATGIDVHGVRMPLGVAAGITPFNFPVMVPMWMFVPAIACGNAFVLKPSEKDPSAALRCAELFAAAGLPPGVFNVVQGGKEAVDAILEHPDVQAVSFVGSTPVARRVYAAGTAAGKRVQALGGAKNHMVVLPDADIGQAADALAGAAYGSAGERCMAVSVAVPVGAATADALVAALKKRIRNITIGGGQAKGVDMGPLITAEHRSKVAHHIGQGVAEGAVLAVDGRRAPRIKGGGAKGFFLGCSLFDEVTPAMSIYREEIFGPVLAVVRVRTAADALRLVNRHQYGNGAAIFTRDGQAAREFCEQAEAGMVGVNVPIPVPVGFHSFGGWKQSLFGAHAIYGPEGVAFYTRLKTVTTRWPGGRGHGAEFAFPRSG